MKIGRLFMKYIQKLLILSLSLLFFGKADAMQGARRASALAGKRFVPRIKPVVNQAPRATNALKAKYIAGGAALGAAGTAGAYEAIKYYKDMAANKAKINADIAKINLDEAKIAAENVRIAEVTAHSDKLLFDKIEKIKASGINKIDKNGLTPLSLAAKERDLDLVNGLIANGAQVNMKYPWYKDYWFGPRLREPIIEAAGAKSNIEVLKALIDAGARVNAREYYNGQKITPLIKAITNNDFEAVKLL